MEFRLWSSDGGAQTVEFGCGVQTADSDIRVS